METENAISRDRSGLSAGGAAIPSASGQHARRNWPAEDSFQGRASRELSTTAMSAHSSKLTWPTTIFATTPVKTLSALTDAGQRIPLFHYEMIVLAGPGQEGSYHAGDARRDLLRSAEQHYLASMRRDMCRFVRLAEPAPVSNCHGWIFTGGKFGIEDEFVPLILADNGYEVVARPSVDDLAVYRRETSVAHVGVVRAIDGDTVIVEGKWGPFGVFSHAADWHPYDAMAYYRSPRRGHLLGISAL